MAALVFTGTIGCSEDGPDFTAGEDPPLSDCGRALNKLHAWSGTDEISSQRQAALVVACEDGRSLATSNRLDCLLQDSPEEAARCTIALERQAMIEACIEDGGEELREECESSLAEPSPVLLAARMRPLENGQWLELWTCHAPSEEQLAPEPEQLVFCGLQITRKIYLETCQEAQGSPDDCEAGWKIESPRRQVWLREQITPPTG